MKTTEPQSQSDRKNIFMNRRVREVLGSAYSWRDELYHLGNPLSDHWQTPYEKQAIAKIERHWQEAISA